MKAIPLRAELLAAGGSVTNPRARIIDSHGRLRLPIGATLLIFALAVVAWGIVYMAVWAIACLWRWAEPVLTVLSVAVALAVIVIGLGLPT